MVPINALHLGRVTTARKIEPSVTQFHNVYFAISVTQTGE